MAANFVRVNATDGAADSSGTTVATSTLNVGTGNLLVVGVRWEAGGLNDAATATVTDTAGNTFTNIGYSTTGNGTENEKVGLWYCLSSTANAADVITATITAAREFKASFVAQYSYTGTIELGDTGSGSSSVDDTTQTTAPSLDVLTGDLAIGWFANYNSAPPTFTADSPFTTISSSIYAHCLEYIATADGTVSPSITVSESGDTYGAVTAVFQSATGAGGTGFTLTADHGTYAITGSPAAVDVVIAAGTSTYSYTGQAAGLRKGYKVAAEAGAYVLVGVDAVTDWSGGGPKVIVCDSGSYSVVGQGATLRRAAKSIANTGVYNLRGFSVVGGTEEDNGTISTLFRVRKVLIVSTAGRTKWVHYIPVKNVPVTAQNIATFNKEGALEVESIGSGTGLVEWVDYIPIVEVSDGEAGRWRYDNAGWIPVVFVD